MESRQKRTLSVIEIMKRLWPFFRPETPRFVLTLALVIFKVGADMAMLLLCRGVLNIIENWVKGGARGPAAAFSEILSFMVFGKTAHLNAADLPILAVLMGVFIAVYFFFGYFRSFVPAIVISNAAFSIRRALYSHLQCMDLYFFDRTRSGEISSRLTNDINQGVSVFGMVLSVFFFQAILFTSSLYFMLRVNVPLTGIAASVALLFAINLFFFVPRLRTRSRHVQKKLGEISGEVSEKFGGIKVMQSFTNEDLEHELFTERIEDHRVSSIHMGRLTALTSIFGQTLPHLGMVVLIAAGAHMVIQGRMTIANMMFFWVMRTRFFQPFEVFSHFTQQVAMGLGGLDRIFEFFDLDSRVRDLPGALPLSKVRGRIEFREVSFAYPSKRNERVLNRLSFIVEPGMSAAFVGESGSGKTTTADLLSRFYDPVSGTVLIDNTDIREYTLRSLRDHIGVVMQEAILFSGTIRENVRYGRPGATDREIHKAMEMANAWDFVTEMKDGLKTIIGERGVSLSGGQKQRLAIARAFLKDPRILILDEATSALDSVSEAQVQEAIDRLMKGRTTIVIAHRLSTIARVDKIIVLEKGRLMEEGTHNALLKRRGRYARFYKQQIAAFSSNASGR